MGTIAPGTVTESFVRQHVGDAAYERAAEYARDGAVFDARRQGDTLRGRCEGQHAESYNVRAAVSGGAVTEAGCTCPVGADGRCKHVGALLLTWARRPDEFVQVSALDAALARRTRAELMALVRQMIRQEPDLEMLLVTLLPDGRARTPRRATDGGGARLYRRQADAVFRKNGVEWGAVGQILPELEAIEAIGDGFLAQGDGASAAAVYEGLAEAVLDRYAEYARQDEDGLLRHVLSACVEGLGRCLDVASTPAAVRERVLRALFDVLEGDENLGDVGPADEVPEVIARHTTPDEKAVVAGWIRALSPDGAPWQARPHAGLLLDLEAATLGDEEFLRASAALGRDRDRVALLLDLGRADESLAAARGASTANLRGVAELLASRGHGDDAAAIVRQRTDEVPDAGLLEWLLARARAANDRDAMASASEALLLAAPSLDRWRALRGIVAAASFETWPETRDRLILALAARARRVAVEALLDEGETGRALDLVRDEPTVDEAGRTIATGMKLRAAEAAERAHPAEALAIWQKHVDDLIATGRRTQYREAALAARRACALYDAMGDHAGGVAWAASLRERHGRLRALREELAAAGV